MHAIGILGAAGIAPRAVIDPARRRSDVVIGAVASRNADKASAYAAANGIPRAFGGYDALLADPSIDIVYNALPPTGHAEWSIRALQAGKHVLCEKPIAVTAAEAHDMVAAAEAADRVLAEAFHDRYHPAFAHLLALKPKLGGIRSLVAEFRVDIPYDPANIRYDPSAGRRRHDGSRLLPAALAAQRHAGNRAGDRLRVGPALRARLGHAHRSRPALPG